jgi:hypothetical protein
VVLPDEVRLVMTVMLEELSADWLVMTVTLEEFPSGLSGITKL